MSGDLAASTLTKRLNYLERFYAYTDDLLGNGRLDDALGSLDVETLQQVTEGYFQSLRNQPLMSDSEERWQIAAQFVMDLSMRLAKSSAYEPWLGQLQRKLARLNVLCSQLRVGRRREPESVRSLPAHVVEALYEKLDPESDCNPFGSDATRWRVWIAFLLLLHGGLRRGELLILPVDAIKSGFDHSAKKERHWLGVRYNEYEDDVRFSEPGIKTGSSFRQIPVSELIKALVDTYVTNYRGRADHSFLLSSQWKRPLSTEGLTYLFRKISWSLPEQTREALHECNGKWVVTPHDLRHTCAVLRLNQLLSTHTDKEEALQLLRAFFGWSRSSDQPLRYARAVFEERLHDVWRPDFDDRVHVLRSLRR